MTTPKIAQVRAFTVGAGGGADYHNQQGYHWIDDHIATPMSRYPGYEESRRSFGINVLGTLSSRSRPTTAQSASASRRPASPGPGSWSSI
jgi:hypothetical protein